jgi:hypothetical protein
VTTRVEWLAADETEVAVLAPGEEWVGAGEHERHVLTLALSEVTAIEGTPGELRALADRISAEVARVDP